MADFQEVPTCSKEPLGQCEGRPIIHNFAASYWIGPRSYIRASSRRITYYGEN